MKKKILGLIILILFSTGCYDYHELNDRAIIVGESIDYENDEFCVNFEILNSQKTESDQGGATKSHYVSGSDTTLSKAYKKAFIKIDKEAYYTHLKTIIISEDVARNHLKEIIDFIARDPNIGDIFFPVVAIDSSAENILKTSSSESPIVATVIEGLIENSKFKESIAAEINFEKFLASLLDERQDAILNAVSLDDNNKIYLKGLSLFSNYTLVDTLSYEDSATLKLLLNDSESYYTKIACDNSKDDYITIDLYNNKKTDISVSDNEIKIKSRLDADIVEDECNYDFKDSKIYEELGSMFASKMKKEIKKLTKYIEGLGTDVLGFRKKYYIKTRKDLDKWNDLEVNVDVQININKNGVIFEVKKK